MQQAAARLGGTPPQLAGVAPPQVAGVPGPKCQQADCLPPTEIGDLVHGGSKTTTFTSHAVAVLRAEIDAMELEHLIDITPSNQAETQLAETLEKTKALELQVKQLKAQLVQSDWAPHHCAGLVAIERHREWASRFGHRTTLSASPEERAIQLKAAVAQGDLRKLAPITQ